MICKTIGLTHFAHYFVANDIFIDDVCLIRTHENTSVTRLVLH